MKIRLIQAIYLAAALVAMAGWMLLIFDCSEWALGF
jgi:hypothetical protein